MIRMDGEWMNKVYLAGRFGRDDWRRSIVDSYVVNGGGGQVSFDGDAPSKPPRKPDRWITTKEAIRGYGITLDYTGPYVIRCDHGCYHKVPHVWSNAECGTTKPYPECVEMCQRAIERSDIVFAWIEDTECYGTLNEIGYASALGKKILIGGPKFFTELWFTYQCADRVILNSDAADAFWGLLRGEGITWKDYIDVRYMHTW